MLTEPKNALLKQYRHLFALDGVELIIDDAAIAAIARLAAERGTGARGLRSMMEQILQPVMFEIPDRTDVVSIVIGEDTVLNGAEPRYVLQAPTLNRDHPHREGGGEGHLPEGRGPSGGITEYFQPTG